MTLKVIDNTTCGERVKTKEGLEAYAVEGGEFREITIGEGEMFLLPGASLCSLFLILSVLTFLESRRQHSSQPLPLRRHDRDCDRARSTGNSSRCVFSSVLFSSSSRAEMGFSFQTVFAGTAPTQLTPLRL
jgi:hypothetical protein